MKRNNSVENRLINEPSVLSISSSIYCLPSKQASKDKIREIGCITPSSQLPHKPKINHPYKVANFGPNKGKRFDRLKGLESGDSNSKYRLVSYLNFVSFSDLRKSNSAK